MPMTALVYVLRGAPVRWCVLATACPGALITMQCGEQLCCDPVLISTQDPGPLLCSRCRAALDDGVDRGPFDHLDDLRDDELSASPAVAAWDAWAELTGTAEPERGG